LLTANWAVDSSHHALQGAALGGYTCRLKCYLCVFLVNGKMLLVNILWLLLYRRLV